MNGGNAPSTAIFTVPLSLAEAIDGPHQIAEDAARKANANNFTRTINLSVIVIKPFDRGCDLRLAPSDAYRRSDHEKIKKLVIVRNIFVAA